MSFMFLAGKRCVCKKCGVQVIVKYEGEARWTQIGDAGIFEQEKLRKKYGPLLEEKEEGPCGFGGYYLIVENGLCQKCFDKKNIDSKNLQKWQYIWHTEVLYEQTRRIINQHEDLINNLLSSIYTQWLSELSFVAIDPAKYKEIIYDPGIRAKGRLKSLVNDYVIKMRKPLIDVFEKECEARKEPVFTRIISECNKQIKPIYAEISRIEKLVGTEKFIFLQDVNRNIAENLNPVVCYEGSIRVPIEGKGTQYYLEYKYAPRKDQTEVHYTTTRNMPYSFDPMEFEKVIRKKFLEEARKDAFGDTNRNIVAN